MRNASFLRRAGVLLLLASVFAPAPRISAAPNPASRGAPIGVLEIPRRGVRAEIREGTSASVLKRAAGRYSASARIGALGNAVIAGHRTSGNAPFRHLDRVRRGDTVIVRTTRNVPTFKVTTVFVIKERDEHHILRTFRSRALTLYTCHPEGSTTRRLVVRAVFVKSAPVLQVRRSLR